MQPKNRFNLSRGLGLLLVLSLLQAGPSPQEIAKKHPEIQGVYELPLGGKTKIVQLYFKEGVLRHVASGNTESTTWNPVPGSELKFTTVDPQQGTFQLEFLKDEQGRCTRCRVVNEKAKMDATATPRPSATSARPGREISAGRRTGFSARAGIRRGSRSASWPSDRGLSPPASGRFHAPHGESVLVDGIERNILAQISQIETKKPAANFFEKAYNKG